MGLGEGARPTSEGRLLQDFSEQGIFKGCEKEVGGLIGLDKSL